MPFNRLILFLSGAANVKGNFNKPQQMLRSLFPAKCKVRQHACKHEFRLIFCLITCLFWNLLFLRTLPILASLNALTWYFVRIMNGVKSGKVLVLASVQPLVLSAQALPRVAMGMKTWLCYGWATECMSWKKVNFSIPHPHPPWRIRSLLSALDYPKQIVFDRHTLQTSYRCTLCLRYPAFSIMLENLVEESLQNVRAVFLPCLVFWFRPTYLRWMCRSQGGLFLLVSVLVLLVCFVFLLCH